MVNLNNYELKEIEKFSEYEKEMYYKLREKYFTHGGAVNTVIVRKTPLYRFYNEYTGCICIPKRLFKDDILKASIEFITSNCEKGENKGYAIEYSNTECEFCDEDEGYFEDTFYCIREVEPF